jgi:hypothetical protein
LDAAENHCLPLQRPKASSANVPICLLRRVIVGRYAVPKRTQKGVWGNNLTGVKLSKYGRKVAGALIQNGILATNVSIYDEGFVKIGGRYEELLGILGDTAVSKKSAIERGIGIVASAAVTPFPGINLLLPGQRGRISLTIITDKKTHVLSTDQVHETAVRDYQKLLGAGQAVLQQIQLRTMAGIAPATSSGDLGAQLKQLSDLHAQGVLSDDEFAAAKGKLLGS